jgi:hypothetical protein
MKTVLTLIAAALTLAGCVTREPVIEERIIEVKVPVTVPCMGQRPDPVQALRDSIGREEWAVLTTDQRAALVAAQALAHKLLGERATDASAGCR